MTDKYNCTRPNGRKVSIVLEELGMESQAHAIGIFERSIQISKEPTTRPV